MGLFNRNKKMGETCSKCGSRIDHLGFNMEDFRLIESASGDAAREHARSIGGECPKCRKVCCSICYQDSNPTKYACPHCGAKIPGFS